MLTREVRGLLEHEALFLPVKDRWKKLVHVEVAAEEPAIQSPATPAVVLKKSRRDQSIVALLPHIQLTAMSKAMNRFMADCSGTYIGLRTLAHQPDRPSGRRGNVQLGRFALRGDLD